MKKSVVIFLVTVFIGNPYARIVYVSTTESVIGATRQAVAGDTIVIAPGVYTGDMNAGGDPGNLPNGKGYFWIGGNGTSTNPIVVISEQKNNPAILQGSSLHEGYGVHVTGNYVILKNLIIRKADKGVVFDNASFGILEDCEVYNSGAELIHVRDSSCHVTISRNHLYSAGNGGTGSIGEGIYIGTDQARWGAEDVSQSKWGDKAISEGYGGYDWRVHYTRVVCNYISGGISAECIDIKEGTRYTLVEGNMLSGDSIGLKPGGESYDDSFIDQKGVKGTFRGNMFCPCGNSIDKYIAEVTRSSYPHVPDSLTADRHSSPWCDNSANDSNNCSAGDNSIVTTVNDPRSICAPIFDFDYAALGSKEFRSAKTYSNILNSSVEYTSDGSLLVKVNGIQNGRDLKLRIINSKGQTIFTTSRKVITEGQFVPVAIDVALIVSGIYYLHIQSGDSSQVVPVCRQIIK